MNNRPWYQTVKRWGQTNLTEDDPALCDLELWKKQWKRTGIQGLIVNAGGIVAYYPSKYPLQYRAATLGKQDYFGIWNDAAKEAGLVVVARMDINRATQDFYDAHPDWFCVNKDGTPIVSQGRYFSCVNSGYYTQYIPDVLKEMIKRYGPVGFSDNSWKGMGRDTICYCQNCKEQFRAHTGHELPEAVDWSDPVYRDWIRWSYLSRTNNWDLFNQITRKYGGDDCLWLGMLHADPVNLSGGFGDLKALCERSKIIFSDHQSREMIYGFEQNSVNGNLLRLASSEQVLAPESMANYVRGPRTFRLASNPLQETRMWSIEGISGGISPWYHHIGGSQNDSRQFETPVELFQWHQKNEAYLYGRTSLANVGVVWSQKNADFYGRDDAMEKVAYPWSGVCRALSRARIPFLPINAQDIADYAGRLAVLILPDIAILTGEQQDAVLAFVQHGGSLVVSGITGALDENGNPHMQNRIWERLGLRDTGVRHGEFGTTSANWENFAAHTYLQLPKTEQRHEIVAGFENTDILPFGGGLIEVESTGILQPISAYIPPFPIYPPEFSWIRERRHDLPTLLAGELPQGGRAVYMAADIERCYGRSLLPDHARLLENIVRWAAKGRLPLEVAGPGHLDCNLYRQENRIILHIVNLSGCNTQGYCDEIFPVGPIEIKVKADFSVSSANLTVSGESAPVRMENGCAIMRLERIADHEMIVLS